jgi:hypothetical protein
MSLFYKIMRGNICSAPEIPPKIRGACLEVKNKMKTSYKHISGRAPLLRYIFLFGFQC